MAVETHGTQSFQSTTLASKYCVDTANCNRVAQYVWSLWTLTTVEISSIPAVTPQQATPPPRYCRKFHLQNRGIPVVTAVLLPSPLPCRALTHLSHTTKYITLNQYRYWTNTIASYLSIHKLVYCYRILSITNCNKLHLKQIYIRTE